MKIQAIYEKHAAPQSLPELPGAAPPRCPRGWLNFPRASQNIPEHAELRKYVDFLFVFEDLGLDPNDQKMIC